MDEDIFPVISPMNAKKTYSKPFKKLTRSTSESNNVNNSSKMAGKGYDTGVPLTTKVAVEFLLNGKLKSNVCRYCLKISPVLSELDQIMQIAGTGVMYKVTIKQMIACFYPFKTHQDENYPEKICQTCLDKTINAYLFTQQCEQAERALHNCFDDMSEKFNKLDPLERPKKRGRQKLNPNYNVLYAEHNTVMEYAEPLHHIINIQTESLSTEPDWNEFECKKCWQVLPNLESLVNHEQGHPNYMWYHCRLCGKSFVKHNQLKKHFNQIHVKGKEVNDVDKLFRCNHCGNVTENYIQHLQHIEKHKFKSVMKHLIEKKTDQLCLICLKKSTDLVDLNKMVTVHGCCPELIGDKTLYTVLASTLPDMNYLHDYIGTKICEKCLNHAITAYIFIHQFIFTRERLDLCVSLMLNNLKKIEPNANVFVQVSPPCIMAPQEEHDESLLLDENDVDESKLKIDVLEDEFRLKSDSESESDSSVKSLPKKHDKIDSKPLPDIENLAKNATKTYMNKRMINGLQSSKYSVDVCSEFLTFNKRKKVEKVLVRYTCPLCNKHFITEYFLRRHILKHANRSVQCKICNCNFKSKFYLYEHNKMVHLLQERFYVPCRICGRTYTDMDKLQNHEANHMLKTCQFCNKTYVTQGYYENHMQRHSFKLNLLKRKNIQTCSFCEKECANDNELSLHVNKTHLQIKPYSCDMCDRQFYAENNLRNHKKLHSMPTKETCEFCSKTLKSRKQLVIHVRKHIGAKPFCCQVCGQAFYSAYKVRQHMKTYHGGCFCCRICKSIFSTKYELKDHVNKGHNTM